MPLLCNGAGKVLLGKSLLWSALDLGGPLAWGAYDVVEGLRAGFPPCCVAWFVLFWLPRAGMNKQDLSCSSEGWRAAYARNLDRRFGRVACPRCLDRAERPRRAP